MSSRSILAAAVALGLSATSGARAADVPDTPVVALAGGAYTRIHPALPWRPVDRPRRLRVGEQLRCEEGCRMEMPDRTAVELVAGTHVVAASPAFFRFEADGRALRCRVVEVVAGEVRVARPAAPSAPLLVTTAARATIAVERGDVAVRALSDRTGVLPLGGRASLHAGPGRWTALSSDRAHTVDASGRARSRPRLAAPVWEPKATAHHAVAIAAQGSQAEVGRAWKPVPGAVSYQVEVAADARFERVLERASVETTSFSTELGQGRYFVRVAATDRDGFAVSFTPAGVLRVVRAALPAGGFMPSHDVVVVPEGERLELFDARDVEIAIDKSGFYGSVSALRAPARSEHRLRLRLRGMPQSETLYRYEKRALRAEIRLTPELPLWPRDSIDAVVRMADPSGRCDPHAVTPALEVRVGGATVPVRWRRDGEAWIASIPGRRLRGPALVEVTARDEQGRSLGSGFVEVVAGR